MESLKLKTKLLYLLISVGLGLLVVAFIGYVNLLTMKRNVDTLYFGSMIPLTELSAINTAYHHEFESNIYRWREELLSDEEIATIKEELLYAQNQLEKRVNARRYKKSKHDNHATDGW